MAVRDSPIAEELDNIKYSTKANFLKFMPKQDQTKIISGKDLGQLALPNFCPRCFWLERHNGKAPSIFPGIFNTLDRLAKRSVKQSFVENNKAPGWLPLSNIKRIVDISRINLPVKEYGDWILTGDPDNVFELSDGSFHIVDYKTAKFTEKQDELFPMYEVQLNAYAFALIIQGIRPISGLSLIYCEPSEDLDDNESFRLSFKTNSLRIEIKPETIPLLLKEAREVLNSNIPPNAVFGCKNICSWVEKVIEK